jgi:hypothetical protein
MKDPMGASAEHRSADRDRTPALRGRLSAVSLFDLCQFLMLNRKTGTLTVRAGSGTAYLVFLDGQLLSATDDEHKDGESVVLRAVQWPEGTFEFAPGPVPPDRRIQASTENILLEAARQVDEIQAEQGIPAAEGHGAESAFREKQERGASLVEAFRDAVAGADLSRTAAGWKGSILQRLGRPSGERLILGPGSRVVVVADGRCEQVSGAAAQEVRSWMDELAPPALGRTRGGGIGVPRPVKQADGSILWAVRAQSPGGDWVAVSMIQAHFPAWTDLGLPESDLNGLDQVSSGLILVLGERACGEAGSPVRAGLGAWLRRRTELRHESGIIVEDLPRFDCSSLPGSWHGCPAAWLRREGRLDAVVGASGARMLVWVGTCGGRVLNEALRLAQSGHLVVLAEEADDPADWMGRAESRLALDGLPPRLPEGCPGLAWQLRAGPPPSGLPLQSRLLRPDRGERAA